jgi:acyl-[acyl carrier protein]--UDP-N-acetylglucosamine O-acyltransferase
MEGVNMGLGSICHQFKIIGAYSMIGMGTIVTKNSKIEPGNIYIGSPSRFLKENTIGLERNNINKEYLNNLIIKFNFLTDENKL